MNFACFTHFISLAALLDCSPTLDGCANDVEAALAFTSRTGNEHAAAAYVVFRQLVRALRGDTSRPGSFTDDSFDEAEHLGTLAANPMAAAYVHIYRALSAAVMGDPIALAEHGPAAVLHAPYIVGFYPVALAHVLNGLSHAHGARTTTGSEPARAAHLSDLDVSLTWLQARSSESPDNFAHLATWVAAERAWAVGDLWSAAGLYDDARRQVAQQRRPWHQALITERAALFHLDAGLEHAGRDLLREARAYYVAWSATGKVTQLDHDHPFLTAVTSLPHRVSRGTSSHGSGSTSSDEIELLAILHATQILSSETDPDQLRARIGELLGAMTGADTIMIALRDDQANEWTLWDTAGGSSLGVPLDAESGMLAPLTVLRYVQRTVEPLLLDDAGADSRFADDPYLTGLADCSLLAIPVAHQGDMRAVLLLENRNRKAAFAASGLEAVMLITGQLAVSLDNAQLYASLERKVRERTIALEDANRALEVLSTTDALTQLPNRRHFDITLDAECRRAIRDHTSLAVAMIDVDHFKRYNDGHGHPAGDVCLRLVAATLRDELRAVDTACRYGGEEFAVVLPGADRADGLLVAERMRAAVAALTVAPPDGLHSQVTISIGVAACLPDASTASADLVATADRSLYEAKSAGRNTVRSSPAIRRAPEQGPRPTHG